MKIYLTLILTLFTFSQEKIIFGKLIIGNQVDSLQDWKIDAATTLAAGFTKDIAYLDFAQQKAFLEENPSKTYTNKTVGIASEFDVDYYAIFNVNRLENMLGVNLTLKSRNDSIPNKMGMGYATLNFKMMNDNSPVYDIALTNAIQRAFATAFNDSLMYDSVSVDEYKVYPQKTLVIGGLEFIQSEIIKSWQLFDDKVVNSYDFAENMWEVAKIKQTHIVYDIATRDTLYTRYNMYGIENYDAPTKFEIKALNDFAVDQYITGKFTRKDSEVEIEIYLCDVKKSGLEVVAEASDILDEDSIVEAREIIRKLVKEILEFE